MCFSADEAVFLSQQGFSDLMVAYPTGVPASIENVCRAVQQGADITLMIDSVEHVERIEQLAKNHNVNVPLCLDVDMSTQHGPIHFGVQRSPVRSVDAALKLHARIGQCQHVRLEGVMGYDAQVAGVMDNVPGQWAKNHLMRYLKRKSIASFTRLRGDVVQALGDAGAELRFVNGGGSMSLLPTSRDPACSEIAVGSAFYASAIFDNYVDLQFVPAAMFALAVARHPGDDIYTCSGGGYVASGAAGKDRLPTPYLPEDSKLLPMEGAGEVQTPVLIRSRQLQLGDPVFIRHAKAGEICERFKTALLIENGTVTQEVNTYRGDQQCFF
jgi:D-serine deaminase-like pyridoxal phosphate-dependent protein